MKRVNELTNNNCHIHNKTLSLPIFEVIIQQGYIDEISLFSFFPNRRLAIEAIRRWTNGKYHILQYEIANGTRCYRFSEYYVLKNGISQRVTA